MRSSRDPLRVALVLFLLASAVIFAVGTSIERAHSGEGHRETTASSSEGISESSGEESGAESHPASPESSETIFGVNPDSPWLVAVVVAVTLLLAAAVWARPERWLLLAVVIFGLAAAVFDIRELVHQVDAGRTWLVALAALLAAVHL